MRITRLAFVLLLFVVAASAFAQATATTGGGISIPTVSVGVNKAGGSGDVAGSLQILALLTVLSLAPALLMMTTAFSRIIIVFSFLRTAIGTPTIPPNQVVIGLSLFLTFTVMGPTYEKINSQAIQPYVQKKITFDQAKDKAWNGIREFMLKQTYDKDLALFANMSRKTYRNPNDVEWKELIPAFILSELKTAFIIGFYIFIPFLVIDFVVASTLMSMGMMMMPPTVVALPAKLLVFLLADGWTVLTKALIGGFG